MPPAYFSISLLSAVDEPCHGDNKNYGNNDGDGKARFAQAPEPLGVSHISPRARFYPS